MKKLLTIITAISLFMACDENKETIDSLTFPQDAFVSVDASTSSVLESSTNPIDIILSLSTSASAATAPATVNFSITSDNAVEGVHYTVVDGKTSFNLDANTFSDVLQIIPIDNLEEDGDKLITITLIDAPVTVGFPGPDGLGKSLTLTLQDDDCAFSLESLGAANWEGTDNVPAGEAGPNASLITTSFDGTNLLIEGIAYAWLTDTAYWDEVVVVSNKVIANVDLVTGVIDIPLQPLCTTTWLGDLQPLYDIEATGLYTSCSKTMVLNYTLYQGGSIRREYSETIIIK